MTDAVPDRVTIRLIMPAHLRTLARVEGEVPLEVPLVAGGSLTRTAILDALEARYPVLRGAIRDQVTGARRPLVRFFACEEDLSHDDPDRPLPERVMRGEEPFMIVGAIAGGAA